MTPIERLNAVKEQLDLPTEIVETPDKVTLLYFDPKCEHRCVFVSIENGLHMAGILDSTILGTYREHTATGEDVEALVFNFKYHLRILNTDNACSQYGLLRLIQLTDLEDIKVVLARSLLKDMKLADIQVIFEIARLKGVPQEELYVLYHQVLHNKRAAENLT